MQAALAAQEAASTATLEARVQAVRVAAEDTRVREQQQQAQDSVTYISHLEGQLAASEASKQAALKQVIGLSWFKFWDRTGVFTHLSCGAEQSGSEQSGVVLGAACTLPDSFAQAQRMR